MQNNSAQVQTQTLAKAITRQCNTAIPYNYGTWQNSTDQYLSMTYQWLINDLSMTYQWLINDLSMTYQWLINDLSMTYQWLINDLSMTYQWLINDLSMTYQWLINDLSMTYQWLINDLSMTYQWLINDLWICNFRKYQCCTSAVPRDRPCRNLLRWLRFACRVFLLLVLASDSQTFPL